MRRSTLIIEDEVSTSQMGQDVQNNENGAPQPDNAPQVDDNSQSDEMPLDGANPGEEALPDVADMPVDANGGMDKPSIGPVPTEEDDFIDVTDLTDEQSEIGKKIDSLMGKFSSIYDKVEKLSSFVNDTISKNEDSINDLRQDIFTELEKRIPTEKEKLNIRTLSSGPYDVDPQDYWAKVAQDNPNYDINMDNSPKKTEKEYVLTNGDIERESTGADILDKDVDDM